MAQPTQLAVQLYTLRDFCKTAEDFAETCRRLREQGWGAVQVSAVGVKEASVIKQVLDEHGLVCCATHPPRGQDIWEDPQTLVDYQKTLDCELTAIGGYFPKDEEFSESGWSRWLDRFAIGVRRCAEQGVKVGYHNHSHEWGKLGGKDDFQSKRAIDLILEKLPSEAWFELDVYWVAHAGGSPTAWLERLAGRLPVIHAKDLGITQGREPYMAEVGVGNLDWDGILAAANAAGVRWWCVEQDVCYRDPFDSLETSLKHLKGMGLS